MSEQSISEIMALEANMPRESFLNTLKKTVMPSQNVSDEHVAAFLVLAHKYKLDPLSEQIHAFPSKGGVKAMIGIDGWISIAQRQAHYDGFKHIDRFDEKGKLVAVTAIVRRKDHSEPTEITEYMDECSRDTTPWKQFPKRMLRHKAIMQGIRMAFGISNLVDEDEAADIRREEGQMKNISPKEGSGTGFYDEMKELVDEEISTPKEATEDKKKDNWPRLRYGDKSISEPEDKLPDPDLIMTAEKDVVSAETKEMKKIKEAVRKDKKKDEKVDPELF
jgi:phage recombination protein Bet